MKKLLVITFVISVVSMSYAQSIPFEKFDRDRIDVGTLYTYYYSRNGEGSAPDSRRYIYVKKPNDFEMFIIPLGDTVGTWLEEMSINWNYMTLDKRSWKNLENKDSLGIGASLEGDETVDFGDKTLHGVNTQKFKDGFKKIYFAYKFESIPSYFYSSTDLLPLCFALRFYPLNKEAIDVNNVTNGYNTKFEIKYEGKERVNVPFGNVLCYKFELVPQLSFFMRLFHSPKKAFIWLTAEDNSMYLVKYLNDNEQNTFVRSLEYRLVKRTKMSIREWEAFKEKHGVKPNE